MPDIKLTCQKCGKVTAFSEFADLSAVRCKCGERLEKPVDIESQRPKKPALTLKSEAVMAAENPAVEAPSEWHFHKATEKPEEKPKFQLTRTMISSFLFIVGASAYAYCRFAGALSIETVTIMTTCAPLVFGAVYILLVLSAFKDTVFQGLLCLVPGYPLYYIFLVSDDFYLRAVTGIMLAGAGYDSLLFFNEHLQAGIVSVQRYIASGG